jgi:hypothetical protein
MAESTLSISWTELQAEVGFFLGYGYTEGNWSAAQLAEIGRIVQSGVRQVYYPVSPNPADVGYEWSFLSPTTTLAIVDGTSDYDLPDDFGSISGNIHFPADTYEGEVVRVPESRILALRTMDDREDEPVYFAIRPKSSDQTAGQKSEVIFWPTPSTNRTMIYSYEAYSGSLTDTRLYPLGGMRLSELYIESCLAIAEQRSNDTAGIHTQKYASLLSEAIARDRRLGARYFGQLGNIEEVEVDWKRGYTGGTYDVTYKGAPI